MNLTHLTRAGALAAAALAIALAGGCAGMGEVSSKVALSTQLRGANEVPPVVTGGSGSVDAAFDKKTSLLRWKVNYTGLSGPATAAHFHGPAMVGANAGVALGWTAPIQSPMEGRATLTPTQAADLLAGRWYANVHTAANPSGEIRGQMIVRN